MATGGQEGVGNRREACVAGKGQGTPVGRAVLRLDCTALITRP